MGWEVEIVVVVSEAVVVVEKLTLSQDSVCSNLHKNRTVRKKDSITTTITTTTTMEKPTCFAFHPDPLKSHNFNPTAICLVELRFFKVQETLKRMDATCSVESQENIGTTFTLDFPTHPREKKVLQE